MYLFETPAPYQTFVCPLSFWLSLIEHWEVMNTLARKKYFQTLNNFAGVHFCTDNLSLFFIEFTDRVTDFEPGIIRGI